MKQSNLKKTVGIATVALAVSAGAAAGVYAYQSGNDFNPDSKERELKANQVSFSDNTDIGKSNEDKKDNSALWEKDQRAQESERPNNGDEPSYLFENILPDNQGTKDIIGIQNEQDTVPEQNNPSNPNQSQNDQTTPDEIFDIVQDESDADVRIDVPSDTNPDNSASDNTSGDNGDKSNPDGDNDAETGNGTGGNGDKSDDKPAESESPSKPDNPSEPENPDTPSTPDNPSTPDTPTTPRPADTAKDPEVVKPRPGITDIIDGDNYSEDIVGDKEDEETFDVCIMGRLDETSAIYKGQSVDAYAVYCALDTYLMTGDKSKVYIWGTEDFNKYIRIDAVSVDGGESWQTQFPVTIPEDMTENIQIKVSYRLKTTDDWTQMQVSYAAKDGRLFVLSEALTDENQTIDKSTILNSFQQYPQIGDTVNLYGMQLYFLTAGEQKKLFPGWTENGKLLPWMYTVTAGRHILEPADFVDLDEAYTVEAQNQWITPEGRVSTDPFAYNNTYALIQTLTAVADEAITTRSSVKVLAVPEYVQAVDMAEPLTVDTLEIPDSVIYINTTTGLNVLDTYEIDEANPNYTSEDGILYNKVQTEIIGIPQRMDVVQIDEKITKITISEINAIRELDIDSTSMDTMPVIDFDRLDDCKIVVRDAMFDDFIDEYGENISDEGNCIASDAQPTKTFTVKRGGIISSDGELYKATGKTGTSIHLTDDVECVNADAFAKASNVKTVMMPKENDVVFKDGALADSGVEKILCYTKAQADSVSRQLKAQKLTDITVDVMAVSADGFLYYIEDYDVDGETKNNVILLEAPKTVTTFDGTIENGEIVVNDVADEAFINCTQLQWVTLPESVTHIGYQAFYGCSSLEGILIDTKDTITIGNKAFNDCDSLRFIASNAMHAQMEEDYYFYLTDWIIRNSTYFFVPRDADGYCEDVNWLYDVNNDVSGGYAVIELADGYPMLYALDKNGNPTVALRSGFEVPERVVLPTTLEQIYVGAFAHTSSATDDYTVNWEDLNVSVCQVGAFMDSYLSGDVTITSVDEIFGMENLLKIYASTFSYCPDITSVTIGNNITYMGDYIFAGDEHLKSVSFGTFYSVDPIFNTMLFDGCNELETIEFADFFAPSLAMYSNMGFRFNSEWTADEEAEKLHIVVPKGMEEDYMMSWRYCIAGGYTGINTGSAYLDMWQNIQSENIDWGSFIMPDDALVDALVKSELLTAENHLRQMLGMKLVDEPTEFYPFRENGGMVTLIGAPSYATHVDLSPEVIGMPGGWCLDYIGESAFADCSKLESVWIPSSMVGIYSNAFTGAASTSEKLTLEFEGIEPPELLGATPYTPFVFAEDESKIRISVFTGSEADYIRAWVYALCGYDSLADMQSDIWFELLMEAEDSNDVTQDMVDARVGELLMQAENRLRAMMGLPLVDDVKDMYAVYKDGTDEPSEEETEESEESSESEKNEESEKTEESEALKETEESEETGESESSGASLESRETEETSESDIFESVGQSESYIDSASLSNEDMHTALTESVVSQSQPVTEHKIPVVDMDKAREIITGRKETESAAADGRN